MARAQKFEVFLLGGGSANLVDSELREPKIQHLRLPMLGNKNVRRLDVKVKDAFAVRHSSAAAICMPNSSTVSISTG